MLLLPLATKCFVTQTTCLRRQNPLYYAIIQPESTPTPVRRPIIPILGPFPGQPPLIVGGEFTLKPTPMQWQALEESAHLHESHVSDERSTVGISAAPLVAVLDQDDSAAHSATGRYATLAAVVGLSSSKETIQMDSFDDNSSFMEKLMQVGDKDYSVKLIGIGRANVKDFFYQVPTSMQDAMGGKAVSSVPSQNYIDTTKKDRVHISDNDDDDDRHDEDDTNILMAEFGLLSDRSDEGEEKASPVHAVNRMHTLARQVEWMHQDRRRLVAGIHAGRARLAAAGRVTQGGITGEELLDHDGLGALFGFEEETILVKEKRTQQTSVTPVAQDTTGDGPLAQLENYGLGATAAAFSTIEKLTHVMIEKLQPYYSPVRCASEEHYYEVLSFVSLVSMDKFVKAPDLAWSLRCTNTPERLEQVYMWMYSHVHLLRQEAERVSAKLMECGEECTDLF